MTAEVDYKEVVEEYMRLAREKPIAYARQVLGISLWEKQRRALKYAADPNVPYLSIRSGNGVGKTYLTGAIICQYLDTHCPGYAVCSSSSWKQLLKTVWPTLRRMVREAPVNLAGDMQMTEWRRGDQWGAFCVSPDAPENFSGFRTENGCLVIVDEASALEEHVHEAIMGLTSAKGSKVVYLGNPLQPEGPFYDTFSNPDWANVHISSEEVIQYNIPGLATQEWLEARIREWGTDSPMYDARVAGNFPESTVNSLIKLEWLDHIITPKQPKPKGTKKMGADIARFGDDRTVLLVRDERAILETRIYYKKNTMESVGLIRAMAEEHRIEEQNIFVDDTGLGGGVTDRLHEEEIYITPINFGERAVEADKFRNVRAELYWNIRERLKQGSDNRFFIPKQFAEVAKECTWPHYKLNSDSRIQLESKEDIKKRKKRSPDLADALALSFADAGADFGIEAA